MKPTLFAFVLMASAAAKAACPIGTIPSVDNFGNPTCKRP